MKLLASLAATAVLSGLAGTLSTAAAQEDVTIGEVEQTISINDSPQVVLAGRNGRIQNGGIVIGRY